MRTLAAGLALAGIVALAACEPVPITDESPGGDAEDLSTDAATPMASLDDIDSCDQVATAVEPYIVGLEAAADNRADAAGILCRWRTPTEVRELEDIRTVEVILTNVDATAAPDEDEMDGLTGVLLLEDAWLDRRGGIAYSLLLSNEQGGVITTTVWVPGIVATISGGQWSDLPALDGPAAIDVVADLLD